MLNHVLEDFNHLKIAANKLLPSEYVIRLQYSCDQIHIIKIKQL